MSQSVDQAVSDAQRDRFQMEVESSGDSGAAGSSRQRVEGAESRSEVVGREGYAEEEDELMMDYMENKGVGNEEIDRFIHGVDDSGFARRDAGQSKGH